MTALFPVCILTWEENKSHKPYINVSNYVFSISINGFIQDCGISIANALELLQSYTEPLTQLPVEFLGMDSQQSSLNFYKCKGSKIIM